MTSSGSRFASALRHLLGRGVFPYQFAWFLEGPWRRWILSPVTLRDRLPLTATSTVCELGIGGGYYGRALTPLVGRFLGIDLQREMLLRARSRSPGTGLLLVQADAMALPLRSESVDLVIAVTVLGEIPRPEAAVSEVARILRSGGTFSVSEHVPDPDYVAFDRLRGLCESSGLRYAVRYGSRWSYTANFTRLG